VTHSYLVTYIPIFTTAFLKRRTNRRVRLKAGRRDAKSVPYYITDERFNTYDDDDPPRTERGSRREVLLSRSQHRAKRVCLRRFRARRVPAIYVVSTVNR
jgi:hypothetical protein